MQDVSPKLEGIDSTLSGFEAHRRSHSNTFSNIKITTL